MIKRKKKKYVLIIMLTMISIATFIFTFFSNITVMTTNFTISSNRIPASFNNFKIVIISDLHNKEFNNENNTILKQVKKVKPDIIAITGDLVDSNKTDFNKALKLVNQLVKIAPSYFVTGNHEAWINTKYQELEKLLINEGVYILNNKVLPISKANEIIKLAGVLDPDFSDRNSLAHHRILELQINNMNLTNDYTILLSHRPELFDVYVNTNIDLVLSGHAHGGQFRLPFVGGIIAPNQGFFPKYDAGIYQENNTTMIVSRGIGNSIIPIRINNQPEIVSIKLISTM